MGISRYSDIKGKYLQIPIGVCGGGGGGCGGVLYYSL